MKLRRPYHVFTGFQIGLKAPSRWFPWIGDDLCPYCSKGNCRQIGTVVYEGEVFSLIRCIHDDCSKLHETKEDARRKLWFRFDQKANATEHPDGEAGTHWEVIL